MPRSITDYFGKGKAEGPGPQRSESPPSEITVPPESVDPPETSPEEEAGLILNAKWPNSVFKFFNICDYVPRFDSVMQLRFTAKGLDIEGMDRSMSPRFSFT